MPGTLRAVLLAGGLLFAAACGGKLPGNAPAAPTAIPLPTHQPAFGNSVSNVAPATATTVPLH
jgi:hypothetical protein